jgi:uncharacterized repeat protein (TIGR03806 family)
MGCGGGSSSSLEVEPGPQAAFVAPQLNFPTSGPNPRNVGIERAFPKLNFWNPVGFYHAPDGSDRVFIVELRGVIRVFENDDAADWPDVSNFLDIRSQVMSGAEMGLLGLAFDPDFVTNGYFYVNYTTTGDLHTVVTRFKVDPNNPDRADHSSELELLRFQQPTGNHNGGMMAFGPDGMLYIATGDGGLPQMDFAASQDLESLFGCILRIDVRQAAQGDPYSIPADNPLVGMPNVREEIWAWGFRNPWRFTFDPNNGDLWCGDVGLSAREELNLVVKGGNYGWPIYEGNKSRFNPTGLPPSLYDAPILDYDRDQGTAIIGGYVYRGSAIPELRGTYIFGDNGSGRIWGLLYNNGQIVSLTEFGLLPRLTTFGEDQNGEIYLLANSGTVYRVVSQQPSGASFPTKLSETGLFTDLAGMTPAPGVVPYGVNSPLWSDGADKQRWIAVPSANSVGFSAQGNWQFPKGTVLVKHFELPTVFNQAQGRIRLETRVLVHEELGWAGYTYKWLPGQLDALLIDDRVREEFTTTGRTRRSSFPTSLGDGLDPDTLAARQTWTYPSRPDCLSCHTDSRGRVLGVRTSQLNSVGAGDQLADWQGLDFFTSDIGASNQYSVLPNPRDPRADLEDRARSYLDANCSHCHMPGGGTPMAIDLRFETALSQTNAVNVTPTSVHMGIENPAIIRSGDRHGSVLWKRLETTEEFRMPPLGSERIDQAALDLLGRWIDSLN